MHKLILSFKGRILKVYRPEGVEFTIGRHPECDMVIDNLAVEPIHAKVHLKNNQAFLTIPSEEFHILLNQRKPDDYNNIELTRGDEIQIGKHTVSYLWESEFVATSEAETEPEPIAEVPPVAMKQASALNGWLQIMSGPKMGRTMHLNKARHQIGSAGKQGALITNRDNSYFISHLDVDLPVTVDNEEVGDNLIQLQDGNTIQVGDTQMLFFTQE